MRLQTLMRESEKETVSKNGLGNKNRERRARKEEQTEESKIESTTGKGQKKKGKIWSMRGGHSVKTGRTRGSD